MVEVVLETTSGVVLESKLDRFLMSSSSTSRNGRYLFPALLSGTGGLRSS